MSRKQVLGQGLNALLGNEIEIEIPENKKGEKIIQLPLDCLLPNPDQPRRTFNQESLQELAESIRQQGIVQPILVEKQTEEKYHIIAGERRWRAASLAAITNVPVIVRNLSNEQKLEIALVENIQREDLRPLEEAAAYARLMEVLGLTQQEVADKVGKKRSTVANSLRLLRLSSPMKAALEEGRISAGHARALLSVDNEYDRETLFSQMLTQSLSVREAEMAAAQLNENKTDFRQEKKQVDPQRVEKIPELVHIEEQFIETLGTKVVLKGSLSKGKLEISWYNPEDLDRIYEILLQKSV